MRLFLDANVLFTAAHNPNGKAALVIELGAPGHWQLFSSPYAFEEARRNLQRKFPDSARMLTAMGRELRLVEHRPSWGLGRAKQRQQQMGRELRLVDHRPSLESPEGLAEKDRPIFQAALACRAGILLTGDLRDSGRFMNRPEATFGVRVMTVADFLRTLVE